MIWVINVMMVSRWSSVKLSSVVDYINLKFVNAGSLVDVACLLDDVSFVNAQPSEDPTIAPTTVPSISLKPTTAPTSIPTPAPTLKKSITLSVANPVANPLLGYTDLCPTGWSCSPNNVWIIMSVNPDFGGSTTPDGKQLVVLFVKGSSMAQTVSGLIVSKAYTVSFYSASRNGSPEGVLAVSVGGANILEVIPSAGTFQTYKATFTATSSSVSISFENKSTGHSACFLGDIKITGNFLLLPKRYLFPSNR